MFQRALIPSLVSVMVLALAISHYPHLSEAQPVTPVSPTTESAFNLPSKLPVYQKLQAEISRALLSRNYKEAKPLLEQAILIAPHDPVDRYNLACALNRLGKPVEALKELQMAVDNGMTNPEVLSRDEDLASLRETGQFQDILKRATELSIQLQDRFASRVTPFPVMDGKAEINEANTTWDFRSAIFRSYFEFSGAPETGKKITTGNRPEHELLLSWEIRGSAAGNKGDLYHNQDRGHSTLDLNLFPGMGRLVYSEQARKRGFDNGLQVRFLCQNAVVLGNSSTAVTNGVFWRSQARVAYTSTGAPAVLHAHYQSNHLYCYPEHHDHDPGHNGTGGGYGDVFPANTPYVLISQGSSWSDRPFLEAFAATLAAFRRETKQRLIETGGIAPALQMILRRSNPEISSAEDYLSGKAHPTAFNEAQLDPVGMVQMAQSIVPDSLPPRVKIRVLKEEGTAYGGNQRLFDTPQAVARVFRTQQQALRMIVTSQESFDLDGKPLAHHWKVLRGDGEKIQIKSLNENGSVVELTIPWHERRPVLPGFPLESNRVDIGAFVGNGVHYSAPAFVSVTFADSETRIYDGEGRLQVLDFTDEAKRENYVDPRIFPRRDWRDEFAYDGEGQLAGWTRRIGEEIQEYTREGFLIVSKDKEGQPDQVKLVIQVQENIAQKGQPAVPSARLLFSEKMISYERALKGQIAAEFTDSNSEFRESGGSGRPALPFFDSKSAEPPSESTSKKDSVFDTVPKGGNEKKRPPLPF